MGNKKVCLECRKAFSQGTKCPNCGKPMILVDQKFKPPKIADVKKWEAVKYLIANGFYYQRIFSTTKPLLNNIVEYSNPVPYPDNLKEAKEFVEKYKKQLEMKK